MCFGGCRYPRAARRFDSRTIGEDGEMGYYVARTAATFGKAVDSSNALPVCWRTVCASQLEKARYACRDQHPIESIHRKAFVEDELEEQLILNRYRPIEEAGAGGFGTVQLAWDTRIQRRVAVKCMELEGVPVDELGEPLDVSQMNPADIPGLEEARTAALLSNANIVSVYDFEVQGSTAYLIMEYVDGLTLSDLLKTVGDGMTLDMVTAVFDGVAHALEYAHENQVLHLDIKPDNVLIDHQGQVKVTDFGLSRLSDAQGFSAAVGGTIGYMPPEQMLQEPLDMRCDEWALASMAYEMIAGKNPFLAPDIPAAVATIDNAEIVLPSLCMEGLSEEIDDVLFYALDPDRNERYASIADFSEEMDRFLGDAGAGAKDLGRIVTATLNDEYTPAAVKSRLSLFDRLSDRAEMLLQRVWSVVNLAFLGFATLSSIDQLGGWGSPVCWGLFALLLLAGALVPHIGALLALAALSVALFANGAYVLGSILVVAGVAWWFAIARLGEAHANTALTPGSVGIIGFNQVVPLLCGLFLDVREAAINAGFAALIAVVLSGFGSVTLMGWNAMFGSVFGNAVEQNVLRMVSNLGTWAIIASWILAAVVSSLFCARQTRVFVLVGAVCGGVVLFVGICATAAIASGGASWSPPLEQFIPTFLAVAVMAGASYFGCPKRPDRQRL